MKPVQLHRIDLNLLVTFEALMEEGSVVAAAERLALTPSAVSHALRRLRIQLDDPVLVKVGGRMQPSPCAERLLEDIRPILRGLRRALARPEPFDAATSDRVFRIALPCCPAVVALILTRVRAEAPGVMVEWANISGQVYAPVADGLVDIAHVGGDFYLPQGLEAREMAPFVFWTYARRDHPAARAWNADAAARWPHLQVKIDSIVKNPVDRRYIEEDRPRHVGAMVSEFAAVAPVLARTDYLATLPDILLAGEIDTLGLAALQPVAAPPRFRSRFVWSTRLATDPGNRWFREIVMQAWAEAQSAATAETGARAVPLPVAAE